MERKKKLSLDFLELFHQGKSGGNKGKDLE
jgi:hypothetical protein